MAPAGGALPAALPPAGITTEMLQQAGIWHLAAAPAPAPLNPALAQLLAAQAAQQAASAAPPPAAAPSAGGADSGSAGGGGGRFKSTKQHEANKVAQQRYRERKKAKYSEMEATVGALQAQLAQLQALAQRNQILEGANSDLQRALVAQEGEVDRLKAVLDAQADASLASASAAASGEHSGDDAGTAAGAGAARGPGCGGGADADQPCVPCDVLPRDLAGIDFKTGFAEQVARLRAFLSAHALADAPPSGAGVDPGVLRELAQVVGRCCQLCQAAIRADGVRVLDLVARDPAEMSSAGDAAARALWERALGAMRLTPGQQQQLLLLRASHLAKLREIYKEREGLNMAAMSQMLPHASPNPQEDSTLEGRMACVASGGYLPAARSNAALAATLDAVKENLRREQRAVMDLNCLTISRILSPVQAARYMDAAYPHHCDALALSNVLAQKVQYREEAGGGGGLASAGSSAALGGGCAAAAGAAAGGGGCC
jgi:hypothetical protein